MIEAILVTHGELGISLKKTLEGIIGPQTGFFIFSNLGLGMREMTEKLKEIVEKTDFSEGAFIFVDLYGGSCWQAAKASSLGKKRVALLSGASLPMLVNFFSKREKLPYEKLVQAVIEGGVKGIKSEFSNADYPL
jgi:mannose/fructose/sorbose-specific phosphotransferase system IIA component